MNENKVMVVTRVDVDYVDLTESVVFHIPLTIRQSVLEYCGDSSDAAAERIVRRPISIRNKEGELVNFAFHPEVEEKLKMPFHLAQETFDENEKIEKRLNKLGYEIAAKDAAITSFMSFGIWKRIKFLFTGDINA